MRNALLGTCLLLALLFSAAPAFAAVYDIVRGTEGDDVIFGDLGHFSGMEVGESGGLAELLRGLNSRELGEISRMLEGRNGIEGRADNADAIFGLAGDDIIFAQGGHDRIDGGRGADMIFAGSGNDVILHDPDDSHVDGGSGLDVLLAAPGCPSLEELEQQGRVAGVEMLLVMGAPDILGPLPGLEIVDGKALLDPKVWLKVPDARAVYVSPHLPGSRLEIAPGVDVIWLH